MTGNNKYKLAVLRYILAPSNKLENQERLLKGRCFQIRNQYLFWGSLQHLGHSQGKDGLLDLVHQHFKRKAPKLVKIPAVLLKAFLPGQHLLCILGFLHLQFIFENEEWLGTHEASFVPHESRVLKFSWWKAEIVTWGISYRCGYSEICIETQRSGRSEDVTANTGPWLANVLPQEGPGGKDLQAKSTSFLALNSSYQGVPPDFF